jgi:hypothetical protein
MFVVYMKCKATNEGDPTEYVIGWDYLEDLTWLDYDMLEPNESLWMVPNTGADNEIS